MLPEMAMAAQIVAFAAGPEMTTVGALTSLSEETTMAMLAVDILPAHLTSSLVQPFIVLMSAPLFDSFQSKHQPTQGLSSHIVRKIPAVIDTEAPPREKMKCYCIDDIAIYCIQTKIDFRLRLQNVRKIPHAAKHSGRYLSCMMASRDTIKKINQLKDYIFTLCENPDRYL
jgi:hypothetical protein